MSKQKPFYAAVPNRAFVDGRLRRLHLGVLGVIAAHDRFGANGKGCTISTRRIAALLNAKQPNVATARRQLAAWGYVREEANPSHAQKKMLRVVYDGDADRDAFFARQTDMPAGIGSPPATDMPAGIGEPANRYACGDTEETALKEPEQIPSKTGEETPLQAGLDADDSKPGEAEDFAIKDAATSALWGPL